jgi:hypothetical protein
MFAFQMEPNDYPHFYLTEDGRLCSMGLHSPGILRVLYDALICLGYDGMLRSTIVDCPGFTTWTGARFA